MKRMIENWNVEDSAFWSSTGRKIALRNLWISIPCLLVSFAVWMMWSIIIVQMQNLGFRFHPDPGRNLALLYTLPAIAGLVGATLRIPHSFLIAVGGGRNVIFISTVLLLIPTLGTGLALQNSETPYWIFAVLAGLSGFGGGNFASSMSNISFFFPKRVQGTYLGLNAGLGNLGVSVMQVLLPLAMVFPLFGVLGGSGRPLAQPGGGLEAGTLVFIQNSGLTWVPVLVVLSILSWYGMNNLRSVTPAVRSDLVALGKILFLIGLGLAAGGIGVFLLLGVGLSPWVVLPVTIVLTVVLMKTLSFGELKGQLNSQFSIFGNKHNWIMTIIYTMTFGSFIGYSAAFPKLIQDVFGTLPDGTINANAPNPFAYAWLGPLVGSLIRPVGGWMSDKIGSGSRVTQWTTVLMIGAALGVAYLVTLARNASSPEQYFFPFLALFLLLFVASGIGNGSTFRSIPYIFPPELAGPVLGWTSAVAAYGAFIIPKVFGDQIQAGRPQYALFGFALYYLFCLALNWWYYRRKNAEVQC